MKRSREHSQGLESEGRALLADLVNMADCDVRRFHKQWGKRLALTALRWEDKHQRNDEKDNEELLQLRDELRLLWGGSVENIGDNESGEILAVRFQTTQRTRKLLRIAEDNDISRQELILNQWLRRAGTSQIVVRWTPRFKGIRPNPHSLEVRLAFACVENADCLRYCRNPECLMPYFIAQRQDQKYCSIGCTTHGQREAKRKWWHENRAK